jgi:hypothetical protein
MQVRVFLTLFSADPELKKCGTVQCTAYTVLYIFLKFNIILVLLALCRMQNLECDYRCANEASKSSTVRKCNRQNT